MANVHNVHAELYNINLIVMLLSWFCFFRSDRIYQSCKALPRDFHDQTYVFGPIAGLTEDNNGTIDWVMAGVWRVKFSLMLRILHSNQTLVHLMQRLK